MIFSLIAAEHETPDQVARRYNLAGEVLVASGGNILLDRGYGPIAPRGGALHQAGERWRLASITKQVTAAPHRERDTAPSALRAATSPCRGGLRA